MSSHVDTKPNTRIQVTRNTQHDTNRHNAAPATIQISLQLSNFQFIEKWLRNEAEKRDVAAGTTAAVQVPHMNEVHKCRHAVARFFALETLRSHATKRKYENTQVLMQKYIHTLS